MYSYKLSIPKIPEVQWYAPTELSVAVYKIGKQPVLCGHDIEPGQYLYHAFSHYWDKNENEIRDAVLDYVDKNYQLVERVVSEFLQKKGLCLENYLDYIANTSLKGDELAIALISRILLVHTAVKLKDSYWTTDCDSNPAHCRVLFAYAGACNFVHFETHHHIVNEDVKDMNDGNEGITVKSHS